MKDKIYEEYGIKVKYLTYKKDQIFFEHNAEFYMISKTNLYETDLIVLDKIVDYADNYAIFFHKIVSNKSGFIFEFGNDKYVLLKPRIANNHIINIDEILKVSNIKVNIIGQNNIESKVDFLEKYLANYDNLNLKEINYFIGLSENATLLFNLIGSQEKRYINHKRISFREDSLNFYNPLNIVIDYKTRDMAEYARSLFLNCENRLLDFLKYFNYEDYLSYFARLVYPSFYFDMLDSFINFGKKIDEKRIDTLANSYEQSLKKLYFFISKRVKIPNIEWLNNVDNF